MDFIVEEKPIDRLGKWIEATIKTLEMCPCQLCDARIKILKEVKAVLNPEIKH